MLDYRPDWLPKNEYILSYVGDSRGFSGYRTKQANGDIHLYRKFKPKHAKKAKYVKVQTFKRADIERIKAQREKERSGPRVWK